jgi:hypothetical protein
MTEQMQRIVEDLTRIAETLDPEKQEEAWRIINRLSHQNEAWPDVDELMCIRLRYRRNSD